MSEQKKSATRDLTLQMRVNEEEYKIIEDKAKSIGLSTSNYMRMVCLCSDVKIVYRK